ncbi:MAG: T9SS C-terminal target domain-containing protein [Calditrichaeota bacterium]|nr:MAG: T9SS C-terminal target domain-containing protein [Calditrichota bacterium]
MRILKNIIAVFLSVQATFSFGKTPASVLNSTSEIVHVLSISEGLVSPLRIAIGADDVIFVADYSAQKIHKFNLDGISIGEIKLPVKPLAMVVSDQKQFLVGDSQGYVQVFSDNGVLMKPGPNPFGLSNLPVDAVFTPDARLFLVDSKNKAIKIFSESGNLIQSFGSDRMVFPTCIAFDHLNKRMLIAEHAGLASSAEINDLIFAYDLNGNFLTSFGKFGNKPGQFHRIQGIAVDHSGHILAADPFQGNITILSQNGEYITTIGAYGSEPGQLKMPMDLAVDSRNRLWVTSMNSGRVEVFDLGDPATQVAEESITTFTPGTALLQNFPNPFHKGTWIPFILHENSAITIRIYNDVGSLVRTIELGVLPAGLYDSKAKAAYWDGSNNRGEQLASGIYFYKFTANNFSAMKRMILLK